MGEGSLGFHEKPILFYPKREPTLSSYTLQKKQINQDWYKIGTKYHNFVICCEGIDRSISCPSHLSPNPHVLPPSEEIIRETLATQQKREYPISGYLPVRFGNMETIGQHQ